MSLRTDQIAALAASKSATLAHYAEFERQAAAEVQQAKDAALWRFFATEYPMAAWHAAKRFNEQ